MAARASRVVLIDRDGVINRDSDQYIKSVAEWEPLPGSLEAIAELTEAGFDVVVITNQSGVGRGLFTLETLAAIHAAMKAAVESAGGSLAGIYFCPHRPEDGCACRKPRPGLLLEAAADLGFDLATVAFIGDKQSDVDAAVAAGARPVIVGTAPIAAPRVERYSDLAAASRALIAETGET